MTIWKLVNTRTNVSVTITEGKSNRYLSSRTKDHRAIDGFNWPGHIEVYHVQQGTEFRLKAGYVRISDLQKVGYVPDRQELLKKYNEHKKKMEEEHQKELEDQKKTAQVHENEDRRIAKLKARLREEIQKSQKRKQAAILQHNNKRCKRAEAQQKRESHLKQLRTSVYTSKCKRIVADAVTVFPKVINLVDD